MYPEVLTSMYGGLWTGHEYDDAALFIFLDDVLRTVLALFMEDEALPLPTLEEVLICNPNTTAEEVRATCVIGRLPLRVHTRTCTHKKSL